MSLNTNSVTQQTAMGPIPVSMDIDPIGLNNPLPMDVARVIFQNLKSDLPSVAMVCKNWKAIADDEVFLRMIRPTQAFGVHEWKEYIGWMREMNHACQDAPMAMEKEGALLTFIPEKVKTIENGNEVLLDNLEVIGKLVGNPKNGNKTGYTQDSWPEVISEKRKQEKPHWVWIKKEVIGRNKTYVQQQKLVSNEENKKVPGAKISDLIDTAISVFMEYVRSGEQIFVWDPPVNGQRTWVRVNEQTGWWRISLGFAPSGLDVSPNDDRDCVYVAVAPARKSIGH